MFGKNHQLKFSIRKLQIGVASLAIGIVGFNTSSYVSAEAITKSIRYEYVTTDELTDLEKQLVVQQLPSNVVDHNDSYYMVYRPVQKSTVSKVLPKTNESGGELSQLTTGVGLLILGISVLKGKKRKVITTLAILTVTGQVLPVSAIQGHTLSTYNSQHTLEIGSTLPDTILDIEGYEFVGYIVTDDVVDSVPVEESSTSNTTSPVVINEEVRFETEVVEIPFDSNRVDDPELEVGTSKVVQQGQKGSVTYTYKVTVKADGNQEREVIETHQVPAVPEVIHIGTKVPVTPNQPVMTTVDETIPRKVIYQADPTLENGQEIVEIEGTDGVLRVTYSDGNKISEEVIQPAVDRIVRYGTQGVTTPIVTTATETIPFQTIYVEDSTLDKNKEVIVQEGVNGVKNVTYVDGIFTNEDIVTPAVDKIIKRGTKELVVEVDKALLSELIIKASNVDKSMFTESSLLNLSLALNNAQAIYDLENSTQIQINEQVQLLQQALTNLIPYEVKFIEIPFETTMIEDPTVEEGSDLVEISPGESGIKKVTVVNGELASEEIIKAPVNRVIQIGTKPRVVKEELGALLELVATKQSSDYSIVSWNNLELVKIEAESIYNDINASQSIVDTTIARLKEAISLLAVEKSILKELLVVAEAKNSTEFSVESWSEFLVVLESANQIYLSSSATQVDIDNSVKSLQSALAQLGVDKSVLETTISTATGKVSSDYSAASWSVLTKALTQAQSVASSSTATQSEIDAAATALKSALAQLGVDKSILETTISTATGKVSSDYSATSWSVLTKALTQAQAVASSSTATQSEVDAAATALKSALNQLGVDKSVLETTISTATGKVSSDYSAASWSVLTKALTQAQAVASSSTATQSEIDAAATALKSALDQLDVDKSVLETTISTATGKVSSDYSAASWSVLTKALTQAQSVSSSSTATQSEIDAADTALKSALAQLGVDKSILETTISTATGKVSSDYSATSWSVLTNALTQAQSVVSSSTATQSEIDAADVALKSALAQLDVDKSVLESTISTATGKVSSDYSATSWSVLTKALTQAQSVVSSSTATQSEIDAADVALKSALAQLGVDKSILESTISTATGKVSSDYSAASWSVLTSALTQAQAIASSSTATQSEIDAADVALKSALANLVQVDKTVTTTIYYPNSLSRVATVTQDNLVDLSKLSFSVENPIPTMPAVGTAEFNAIIAQLEAKVAQDPTTAAANVLAAYKTDSDGDGIIDLYDKEKDVWNVSERDLRFMTSLARSSSNVMNNIFNNKRQTAIDDFNSQRLNNGASITELNQHWKFLRYESPGDGLQYHIFGNGVKADGGYENVVIVFRDTQTSETGDILADLAIAAGRKPAQANYLEQAAQYVMAYNPSRVYSGGTSLGGYLAEYFAASTMQSDSSRSSVFVKSSIFNPAAIYVTSVSPTEVTNARAQADVLLKTTFVDDSDQSNPVTVAKTNSYVMQGDWVAAQLGTYDPTTLFATTSTDQHAMQRFYDDSDALKEVFSRGYRMDNHYQTDDTDGDGLTDVQEGHIGTNAKLADTDGDGFSDRLEAQLGSDPLSSASIPYQLDMTGVITNPEVVEVVAKLVYADGSPTQYIAVEMAAVQQGDQLIYTATGTTRTVTETAISAIKAFDKVVTIIV